MDYFKNIFFYLFIFFVLNIQGQQILSPNYVQNHSFEEYYNCPSATDFTNIVNCKFWWGLSTEYYNACATLSALSVPSNEGGFQYAHTGNAYVGFNLYAKNPLSTDYREAIKTKLIDSLFANKRYCSNFYISLAEVSFQNYILLDSVGILITKDSVPDIQTPILSNGIKMQHSIYNIDTISWFKISNTFFVNGGEYYLTIGNFDNIVNWPSSVWQAQTYIYVDDVSVCECSFNFNLGNDTTLCIGDSLILKPNMPNAIYKWQDGSIDSIYKVTQAGIYWLKAYFPDYNITSYDTINVTYIPNPVVNLGNNTILCQGQTLLLNATTNNATYLWQDGSTAPTFNASQDSTYWVKVTDTTANCSTTATIKLECDAEPVIPNIFTPNGDGSNDNFIIKNIEYWDINLQVFNRWGVIVYEDNNYKNNWDGKCKGNPLADGTYFYIIKAKGKDSGIEKEYKGSLMIMR
ncbi:MAG: gliding motility-associated C-terminal domain-containing protein [Bacteroidota bacterium]